MLKAGSDPFRRFFMSLNEHSKSCVKVLSFDTASTARPSKLIAELIFSTAKSESCQPWHLDLDKYKDEITVMGRVTSAITFF